MLIGLGRGVKNLQHYWRFDVADATGQANQGDTLDTFDLKLHDPERTATIVNEDDFIVCSEHDPAGWPTVNLLVNGALAGPYSGGIAANWTGIGLGAGVTAGVQALS